MPTLTIVVRNCRSDKGSLVCGAYTQDAFKRFGEGSPVARERVPAQQGEVAIRLDVPEGRYAAAVYHDTNDNGRLDLTFVGTPAEPRGYSNITDVRLAPPSFDAAAVEVGPDGASADARLRYPG